MLSSVLSEMMLVFKEKEIVFIDNVVYFYINPPLCIKTMLVCILGIELEFKI